MYSLNAIPKTIQAQKTVGLTTVLEGFAKRKGAKEGGPTMQIGPEVLGVPLSMKHWD